jgi:hypothetical protein
MKNLVLFSFIMIFSVLIFADIVYLTDGTKLTGKILRFTETEIEMILDTGKTVTFSKDSVIRIDPLDTALLSTTSSLNTSGSYTQVSPALTPASQNYSLSSISDSIGTIPATEIPAMYGDPETEMRKRLLMYSEMKKESWVAAELSLLIPSAGHLYTGEWERGFLFLGAKAAFAGLAIYGFLTHDSGETDDNGDPVYVSNSPMLGAVGAGGFALFALLEFVDSYYSAERYNQVLRLRLGIEKFDPMMLPTFSK